MHNKDNVSIELCVQGFLSPFLNGHIHEDDIHVSLWDKDCHNFNTFADIHVVLLINSSTLTEELLIKALVGMENESRIKRLLLFGFYNHPQSNRISNLFSISNQPLMGLLFEAFHIDYYQLPHSLADVINIARKLLKDTRPNFWKENYKRVSMVLDKVCLLSYESNRFLAWRMLDSLSGGINKIKREEHDIHDNNNSTSNIYQKETEHEDKRYFDDMIRFQNKVDHYYLAVSRKQRERPFVFIAIEDNVQNIDTYLEYISLATGDYYYVTNSGDVCHNLFENIKNDQNKHYKWTSNGITYISYPSSKNTPYELVPDCILVDLILVNSKQELLEGEDVIKHIQERFPSLPIIVVTKSEEPDVLTRCVKIRGADRVVPKRRLLRLPYTFMNYLQEEITPFLAVLDEMPLEQKSKVNGHSDEGQSMAKRMIGAYRTWNTSPGILWHGEKTMHAVEHSLEHSKGLWKLANELLVIGWAHINKDQKYTPNELFRFLMSIWLHDIGSKGSEGYQMADQVRERHSWISGELLHRNPELYMLKRGDEADIIELLCSYHQSCAPFWKRDKTKDTVKGLFHQSLEEIEEASKWNLMEWAALLRLLDSIDHNWRRVGNKQLYESKKATIAIDSKYYRERADVSADARRYADWLDSQDEHMKRHMSVMNVTIKTKIQPEELLFWPEYEFASKDDALTYFGQIGCYVLKEWHASGKGIIDTRMHMRLPKLHEINKFNDKSPVYAVCELDVVTKIYDLIETIKQGDLSVETFNAIKSIKLTHNYSGPYEVGINNKVDSIKKMQSNPHGIQEKLLEIQRDIAWAQWTNPDNQ